MTVASTTASRITPPVGDISPLLTLRDVTKRFPGVLALDRVSFSLNRGEAHAVCGENGAGKSTLMKVISGVWQPEEGSIVYQGQPCRFASSRQAEAAGITMIHQELNLVPQLTVAENIYLAREPRRGGWIDRARINRDARACLERLQVAIRPTALVKTLSIAQQQMVEIAKALSLDAQVLIMDEPTSSLTESETVQLFKIINELKGNGVGIVYISHRLDELQHIIDRVTVMRDGKFVSTAPFRADRLDDIVAQMVGRALDDKFPERTSVPTSTTLLKVSNLARGGVFGPIDFTLRQGEILGFAGLMGAGRTEAARAIFGADPMSSGCIELAGQEVHIRCPADAIGHGIAYLSEDRKGDGLALTMPVATNVTLTNVAAVANRFGFIQAARERAVAQGYIDQLGIKTPSPQQVVRLLSGGNQQKVVIAKWLFRGARIMFFDEPTRGIDVGAKFAIYQLLDQLAASGIGVVLISSELPEILGMTDRIAVFREGRIAAILNTRETDQQQVMQHASCHAPAGGVVAHVATA